MTTAVLEWKAKPFKIDCHCNALPSAVPSKVVQSYVEEFRESGMKQDLAEAVWNRLKTEGVCLLMILSTENQRNFVQDITGGC